LIIATTALPIIDGSTMINTECGCGFFSKTVAKQRKNWYNNGCIATPVYFWKARFKGRKEDNYFWRQSSEWSIRIIIKSL